ncbi:MAG: MoaD/ThiS family protein [Bacteroidetes bacterium]|nr:MoaD/ThiS family protein [Bacteroidota bacterium]
MTIQVYAALKDYFEPEFEVTEPVHSIDELRALLLRRNPRAESIMPVCRFAVNDSFVDGSYQLQANDILHIIPPSSGG